MVPASHVLGSRDLCKRRLATQAPPLCKKEPGHPAASATSWMSAVQQDAAVG
jgi:hypothetical protein